MKIKQLDVAGFRSLKNVSWKPGDLNVVIGQNGTGKSNLLRILELISAAAQGQLAKYIEALGGMSAILWDGLAPSIFLGLEIEQDSSSMFREETYKLKIDDNFFDPLIDREVWSARKHADDKNLVLIDRDAKQVVFNGKPISSPAKIPQQETLLSLLNSLSFEGDAFDESSSAYLFRRQLGALSVYHDFDVSQNSSIRQPAVPRYEHTIEPTGRNLVTVLHTLYSGNRAFKQNIDLAMRAAFGNDYEEITFPPASDRRIQFRIRWKTLRREQSAADLSDGTLRFLLILAILSMPLPSSLIAIDEPETGLHPSMLPIIAEFAVEASSRTQVIFTTHSPQFLSAFGKHPPTTTVAEWQNGETLLHTLDKERLDYWLEDYSLGTLFESGELEAMT
ncbi:MAG TPA: AAA family ATPase [Blastocatellia bacterium]|nr:AAA family ATPase [Blastocatellia bacterium]HMV83664.1 AAA family ATPase [Blastocatellia bacterium]HMX24366.1 AAA family ATPase [Blastocatellia bacterium]HMY74614.1 AAA family ATPase [Blastocatellia bacterium]HMZ20372.1 AAA family ATPase [Blastocatellia bacterium]